MADLQKRFTECVSFREDKRILTILDRVARNKGTDRSGVYRESVRYFLAAKSLLTEQEQIDLGVQPTDPSKRVEANKGQIKVVA